MMKATKMSIMMMDTMIAMLERRRGCKRGWWRRRTRKQRRKINNKRQICRYFQNERERCGVDIDDGYNGDNGSSDMGK